MKNSEFQKLRPRDTIYLSKEGRLDSVQIVDIESKKVYVRGGRWYPIREIETKKHYEVKIQNKKYILGAELAVINMNIDSLLEKKLTKKNLKTLQELSELKIAKESEYNKELSF